MASVNYKTIEKKLQLLKNGIDPDEIGYTILSAFGTTDTYLNRYKSGKGNFFKPVCVDGDDTFDNSHVKGILIKKSLAYQATSTLNLTSTLESMKSDENIAKQKARILVVSDGKTLLAYDSKINESYENTLDKVWLDFQFFGPLAGVEKYIVTEENPADVKAAEKMAKLHSEIRRYNDFSSEADLHNLNVFMTRLLFCFFAEDTNIFEKSIFTNFILRCTLDDGSDLTDSLNEVFNVMDEPLRIGQSKIFVQFPYVNGGLFHDRISIPKMGMRARRLILECSELNWGEINPDIFGSMMQAVVTPELRGGLGMHYTSVPNIMKVIQPLFLNDLEDEFTDAIDNVKKLDALLIRISKMKFFDPACGSGNFLIITYKELRRLEIRIWKRITELTGIRIIPFSNISILQFYGIELDSFAHEIAMLSLWLAEHQMNAEFTKTFSQVKFDALPLKNITTIVQGNACRVDWKSVCPHKPEEEVFVFGNPPYLGSSMQVEVQKKDKEMVLGSLKSYKDLDYIACWFYLGALYIQNSKAKYAFVSTNSICQGEQVEMLWRNVLDLEIEIGFAHTSFKWTNNAKGQAAVICAIIGLQCVTDNEKYIFSETKSRIVKSINPYLLEGKNIIISKVNSSISKLEKMNYGNKLTDDGNFILDKYEKDEFEAIYPDKKHYVKEFIGSREFIQGKKRYCLFITDSEYPEANKIDYLHNKFEKIRIFREKSTEKATRETAKTPYKYFFTSYLEYLQNVEIIYLLGI